MESSGSASVASPGPPPPTLYWGSGSPPCWRVMAAFAEKGIPFRSELLTFESGVLKSPAMLSLNPRALVPILVDGPVRMYESLAILLYLERAYPARPLLPTDDPAAYGRALTRMEEANNASVAAGEIIYYLRRTKPEDINQEYLAAKIAVLDAELSLWEMYLVGSEWLDQRHYECTLLKA
jgi:glutathione S-transferase